MPEKLTIMNGAMAMDGGSIALEAIDERGKLVRLLLDWSIAAQKNGTTHIRVDEQRIELGTEEERHWLMLLQEASIHGENDPPEHHERQSARPGVFGSPDIKEYFEAIDNGVYHALRFLVIRFVMLALSDRLVDPQDIETAKDKARALLAAGDRIGAMKILRKADPTMTLKAAQQTLESISP
jgi:hypothetical protein